MGEDQIQHPRTSEKTHADTTQAERKVPVPPTDINKLENSTNTEEHQTHGNALKHKPLRRFEFWMLVLTALAVFFAGGTGSAIIWQDILASASLKDLHRQLVGTEAAVMNLGFSVDANGLRVFI